MHEERHVFQKRTTTNKKDGIHSRILLRPRAQKMRTNNMHPFAEQQSEHHFSILQTCTRKYRKGECCAGKEQLPLIGFSNVPTHWGEWTSRFNNMVPFAVLALHRRFVLQLYTGVVFCGEANGRWKSMCSSIRKAKNPVFDKRVSFH